MDFLQKKMKVNEGEASQYYVENSHPAIIESEKWDLVQAEFFRRKALGNRYSTASVFSSMIICGDCGSLYGSKVWHSTDKYRHTVWQCNNKFKGNHRCTTPHLYEKDIQALFLRAFGKLMADHEHMLEDIYLVQATLCDCTELDAQQAILAEEMQIVGELIRQCIEENTIKVQNQTEYLERYDRHTRRYEKCRSNTKPWNRSGNVERNSTTASVPFQPYWQDRRRCPLNSMMTFGWQQLITPQSMQM